MHSPGVSNPCTLLNFIRRSGDLDTVKYQKTPDEIRLTGMLAVGSNHVASKVSPSLCA